MVKVCDWKCGEKGGDARGRVKDTECGQDEVIDVEKDSNML
jgi:hypothetical protein